MIEHQAVAVWEADDEIDLRLDDAETVGVIEAHQGVPVDPPDVAIATTWADLTSRDNRRKPIVPAWMRNPSQRRSAMKQVANMLAYWVAFHLLRSPWYLTKTAWYAPIGACRTAFQVGRWAAAEQGNFELRQKAAATNDPHTWMSLDKKRSKNAQARWTIVGVLSALALLALTGLQLTVGVPTLAWQATGVAFVLMMARIGRPVDKPIIDRVTEGRKFTKLTGEMVRTAMVALGISAMKEPGSVEFAHPGIHIDGPGWLARINLPAGLEAVEVLERRGKLSSALRLPVDQVWPAAGPDHAGQLDLWVGYQPASKMGQPVWTLSRPDARTSFFSPQPFGTDERQRPVYTTLFETNALVGGQPGSGKALALDTPVPTPGGWSTMGDLKDGDVVYDETGHPCRVVKAHEVRHDRPCYEVHFSDGSVIVADAEHRWLVDSRSSRLGAQQRATRQRKPNSPFSQDQSHRWALPRVLTTSEMLGSVHIQADGRANYSVRVAGPLQCEDANLPIAPYTLGAWLGDGTCVTGVITTPDAEVLSEIAAEGEHVAIVASTDDGRTAPGYRVQGLTVRLRDLGVLGKGNKHIPVGYLRASEDQRRALLAGLLDTDGYCTPTGGVIFAVKDEQLARDVFHLVAGLGYKPAFNSKPARFEGRDYGLQWIVSFTPLDKVFRLPRKASRQVTKTRALAGHRFITDIRKVDSVPVRCITVDSPNSLYLVGEACIPTHNTYAARTLATIAALDPTCELKIAEFKGTGDFLDLEHLCSTYIVGVDDSALEAGRDLIAWVLAECERRGKLLLEAKKRGDAPLGKVTPELAARPGSGLHPVFVLIDEAHELFGHDKQIGQDAERAIKRGRALGIHVCLATQIPDKSSLPPNITRCVTVRWCLSVGGQVENDMILGTGAYKRGLSGTAYRPKLDAGWGVTIGLEKPGPVRSFFPDPKTTEAIVARATALRRGLIIGGGVQHEKIHARNMLEDAIAMLRPDEAGLPWQVLADRLAQEWPEFYGGITADMARESLKRYGVPTEDVKVKAGSDWKTVRGARRSALQGATLDLELED